MRMSGDSMQTRSVSEMNTAHHLRGGFGFLAAAPRALALGVLIGAGADCAIASGIWQDLGPAPITNGSYTGRVSAIACSLTDSNKYYAAGADGGVWKTLNGGTTWVSIADRLPTSAVGALALDPSDDDVLYVGSGEANFANHSRYGLGVFKTTDGGATWQHYAESTFAGRCFSKIIVSPADSQVLYGAVTIAGGFPSLAAAKNHPQRSGAVGVFKSIDGGQTWTQEPTGLPNLSATDVAFDPGDPQTVYACIGHIFGSADNGIYKLSPGDPNWVKLAGGLPTANVGRITIGLAPSNPQRVYALVARNSDAAGGGASTLGAYRSDNGGATWTALTTLGNIQATYGWYLSVVLVAPAAPDTVFMGGLDLRRSNNAGGAWSGVTPPHVDLHALAWDAAGRLLVGDDGGVHRSTDLGQSWTALNAGLGVTQLYAGLSTHPGDPLVVFGGFQDNGTNRRTTNTQNWTNVVGGDGGWTQLDQLNPLRVFGEFQGSGNLYRSTNGGASFSVSSSGISTADRNCFLPPYVIDPTNSNRILYGTQRVYQSTNGGTSWSAISGDATTGSGAIRALAIARTNVNTVYIATNDGLVRRSDNGGAAFTTLLSGNPGWPRTTREITVSPDDPLRVYLAGAVFGVPHVRRSTDGGATWTVLDGDLADVPVNVVEADERFLTPVLYAGTDVGLFRSLDDGVNWHRVLGFPTAAVIDLKIEPTRNRLVLASQGRGVWSYSGLVPGDLDLDGDVDLSDLALLLADFGCDVGPCDADINDDDAVDLVDLTILLGNFGFVGP